LDVVGDVGVVGCDVSVEVTCCFWPPDKFQKAVGEGKANAVPLDDQRDVVPPVRAVLLESLPQGW